jgi:hypothetical protein
MRGVPHAPPLRVGPLKEHFPTPCQGTTSVVPLLPQNVPGFSR